MFENLEIDGNKIPALGNNGDFQVNVMTIIGKYTSVFTLKVFGTLFSDG
jgi:hypothetical protein